MELIIRAEPKEIAALVLALQERQGLELHINPDRAAKAIYGVQQKKEEIV